MNRTLVIVSLLSLGGCPSDETDTCPSNERCSEHTTEGLMFGWGAEWAAGERMQPGGTVYVAKGGVDNLEIRDQGALISRRYVVDASGPAVLVSDGGESRAQVIGAEAGTNFLRVLDPDTGDLYDRVKVVSAPIEQITFDDFGEADIPRDKPTAFVPGSPIAVLLYGSVDEGHGPIRRQLEDTSMTVELPGGGDHINFWTVRSGDLSVGTHAIRVKAGDRAAQDLPLRIVRDIDAIELRPTSRVYAGRKENTVCFNGLNQGSFVGGFTWTFHFLGRTAGGTLYNCMYLDAESLTAGSVVPVTVTGEWFDSVEDHLHSLSVELEVPVI